ncbi:sensor domain-containing diguanylate cyclase [Noviherbaspirillum pedocola]|uniref:diguanylate cyclase n=1 Tax=Noviherbaspirillum pedocola TaxID=2801341 RepID=A0A934SXV1_9BURK|nr:diguanylate cyclase [Noviherbaspirillum pedocola]MBK4737330.1 diguanylate cyclase [Noviherbaspirillum pedocola]
MTRRPLKLKAVLLSLLIAVLLIGSTSLEILLDYRATEQRSYETATDIARVVERQTRDTVTYVQQTLDAVATVLRNTGGVEGVRRPANWEIVRSYCVTLIGCGAIGVITPDGKPHIQTRKVDINVGDVSDRAYFRRAVETRKLYIDKAIVSRLPGSPILFTVSKPVYDSQGDLIAVVAIGMETSQLTSFYSLFGFALAPTISIYKRDGDLVARNPGMSQHVGKSDAKSMMFTTLLPKAPSGTYDSLSPIDGKRRLAAYRFLPDLDLVIFSGIERPVAFAAWKVRSLRRVTIMLVTLALIGGVLSIAYRALVAQSQLRQENDQLDDLATHDPLTGIGNRRLFERTLKRDWGKHCRSGAPLSVVLIDVDFFKPFNDHYGHQAGDACLRRVAQTLARSLQREGDMVARYGGEEFVAVLDCGREGALLMAERMRRRVEALEIPHVRSGNGPFVTASFGVASTENARLHDAEELVVLADKALYAAKAAGRNQVSAARLSSSDASE